MFPYKKLKRQAALIDIVDGFLGPATSMMYLSGNEFLQQSAFLLSAAEVVLMKVPFTISYLAKTSDYAALLHWVPKEVVANLSSYTGFLDIIPTYSLRVNYKLGK